MRITEEYSLDQNQKYWFCFQRKQKQYIGVRFTWGRYSLISCCFNYLQIIIFKLEMQNKRYYLTHRNLQLRFDEASSMC